jgi:hypothetical protein
MRGSRQLVPVADPLGHRHLPGAAVRASPTQSLITSVCTGDETA